MQAVSEEYIDKSMVLSPAQVKAYVEPTRRVEVSPGKFKEVPITSARRGTTEYNHGSILVNRKHPLDECRRRGIIEDEHYEAGKRFQSYRDCALSKSAGRVYNATGEGDPEMDAATIYANVLRYMNENMSRKNQWRLISIVCFTEPDVNGTFLNAADYAALYRLAPNIQYAFEQADEAFSTARKALRQKLDEKKKREALRDA